VPAPSDKGEKPGLPDPELNPMTNPLLARNMGRWAEVYFTSPPEKREAAVQELLRELQKEAPAPADSAAKAGERTPVETAAERPAPICPACLHRNRSDDRFCGLCGFPLASQEPEPVAANTIVTPAPALTVRSEDGWEWLRDRNLASLNSSVEPRNNVWKYLVVVAAVLVVGLIVFYALWSGKPATASRPNAAESAPTAAPPRKEEAPSNQDRAPSPAQPAPTGSSDLTESPRETPSAADEGTLQADSAVPSTAGSEPAGDDGQEELRQGKRYLQGNGVPQSSGTASVWLWRAVAKQNSEAVLLLSEMYVRGDGVPKSCDQARVLLSAAAKRGSTAANDKLVTLQAQCP
jgi:hypothetical protein